MEKVRLGDIAILINGDRGKNYPSQADITENGDVPFVNAGHLNGIDIDFTEMNFISQEKYNSLSSGKFQYGDILYCLRGSLGKKAKVSTTISGAVASSLVIIRPNPERVNCDYLMFALDSPSIREQLIKANNGSSQPNLSAASVRQYCIELPRLELQNIIVQKLTKLRSIITHRKQQLAKLDELVKARFVEMFGEIDLTPQRAEWIPISSIGTVIGGSTPKTSVEEYWDGDLKWITPAELLPDTGYLYDSVRKITKAGVDSCSLQLLPKDTVILTSRAPIGKVAIAGTEMYCNQGFKNIICNDTILPRYLYSLLLYNVDYLNSLGRGATFKEISKTIVEKIKIPIAPIELQNQFAAFVEQTDKSKVAVQKALDEAQLLFDSLMQEYFG